MTSPHRLALTALACVVLTGCKTPPQEYHDVVQHRFELHASTASLDLLDHSLAETVALATRFAAARPNNGSTFVIAADPAVAPRLQKAIVATGVRSADVRTITAPKPTSIVRTDVSATVTGCYGGPRSFLGGFSVDDGYGHDNANSALLGCAVQRNIAAMVDDPRALMSAEPMTPRDGARSADVYENWTKGNATAARNPLPDSNTASTSAITSGSK